MDTTTTKGSAVPSTNSKSPVGTITAAELSRVIDDAALFASRDTSLPMINAIRLESTAKQLIAVATDRFTLGASMASYNDGDGPEFEATLKLGQAQLVARIAKSCREAFNSVAIKLTSGKLSFAFTSGEALTLPMLHSEVDFPDWRKLVTPTADDTPTKVIGYDPALLARFSRVHGASRIAIKFSGPTKPAMVSAGTQFIGAIMPVRLGSDDPEWQSPEWIAPAPPKAKAAAPAKKAAPKTAAKKAS
ncbi:hypothetical protein [Mycolicibacterium sphagni]|uniref:DNA polymerase III beta sliding clamp central domain-containing protein n=1 Tax=Mycolicibacterium sphagni TaxID=1786 RepID=A0A255DBT8_9MYCO|nr:hypothetical protein [Mycolicibacterium sphagni]OYN76846.1 hypothetical protein CG716_20240 [Mycolicibacterium sphagni]